MESVIAEQLNKYRTHILGKLALLEGYEKDAEEEVAKIEEAKKQAELYQQATQILKDLYEQSQRQLHTQIQDIVTYSLREVFGDDAYEFCIKFVQMRNQVEAKIVFIRDGEEYSPWVLGGGILSVACFALRLAVIYLTSEHVRHIMILDEPFSQLSVNYRDKMASLLFQLADRFDFQFVIVTHANELEIGTVYRSDSQHKVTFVGNDYR